MPLDTATTDRIDAIVRLRHATGRAPRILAGVVRGGDLAHVASAGYAGEDAVETVQSRIGSISKTFTAALVLGLRDEGRIDLDEPLAAHLPGLAVTRITPRHVLPHMSGLRRETEGRFWERVAGPDIPGLVASIGPDAVLWPPMTRYHYSNLAYGLLGAAAAAVTGGTWAGALQDRILTPLGLARTTYAATEPYLRGVVTHPYAPVLRREEPREDAGALAPAGQLWSTVADLGRWAAFLLDPASVPNPPLAPETVEEMLRPVAFTDTDRWTGAHSLGFQMWRRGERTFVGHTGSMPGYLAVIVMHRESGTAAVLLIDSYQLESVGLATLAMDMVTEVLEHEPAPVPARTSTEPPQDVLPLLGPWWWLGSRMDVVWDGELVMRDGADDPGWRFRPAGPDEWRCYTGMNDGETLRIRRAEDGRPVELDVATFRYTREVFAEPW